MTSIIPTVPESYFRHKSLPDWILPQTEWNVKVSRQLLQKLFFFKAWTCLNVLAGKLIKYRIRGNGVKESFKQSWMNTIMTLAIIKN